MMLETTTPRLITRRTRRKIFRHLYDLQEARRWGLAVEDLHSWPRIVRETREETALAFGVTLDELQAIEVQGCNEDWIKEELP